MDTVLVTGGAGFIGSHLAERLLSRGDRVICLDNFDRYYSPQVKRNNIKKALDSELFELVEYDIRDDLTEIFRSYRIDRIVHLAARAGVRFSISDPFIYQDVNIRGTINLLEQIKEYGITNFVFASSSSVYGASADIPFCEIDNLTKPVSPYAASKQAGELFCYTYHHLYQISITCLRFFTVYGPRQRPDMAIHKFTGLIDRGEEIPLYGDGTSKRDYTYISDIIDGVISALDNPLGFEVFNLGGSDTTELSHLLSLLEQKMGKKAKLRSLPIQAGDVPITYADIAKAKRLLKYEPRVKIEQGIDEFIRWYKNGRC
ncbi:GDP-mannose 4,6-dehydratase [Chloroflexota bacterium]